MLPLRYQPDTPDTLVSVFRTLGTLVWGAVGAFHLWLLARQAWTGQVEYAEFGRWAVALLLVGALVALRRRGAALFRNRRATAVWVLVALLHGPILTKVPGLVTQALAEAPVVAAQIVSAAAALGLTLALAARRNAGRPIHRAAPVAVCVRPVRALDAHAGTGFLPRPPPAA